MNHFLTLRILILAEVFLAILGVAVGFFDDTTLPTALREYQRTVDEAPFGWWDGLLLVLCLPTLWLSISALVSLWRGKRNARLLYTLSWVFSVLLCLCLRPEVASGFSQVVDTAACLVSGMIFGLIYFSELRHRFSRDYENYWNNGDYA